MLLTANQIESSAELEKLTPSSPIQHYFTCKDQLKKELTKNGFVNFFRIEARKLKSIPTGRLYRKDDVYIKGIYHYKADTKSEEFTVYTLESVIGERGYYSSDDKLSIV